MVELLQAAGDYAHLSLMSQRLRQVLRQGAARLTVVNADIGYPRIREAGVIGDNRNPPLFRHVEVLRPVVGVDGGNRNGVHVPLNQGLHHFGLDILPGLGVRGEDDQIHSQLLRRRFHSPAQGHPVFAGTGFRYHAHHIPFLHRLTGRLSTGGKQQKRAKKPYPPKSGRTNPSYGSATRQRCAGRPPDY